MWKSAARAGLRQIARMVQGGNIAGASALARTPGVLKPSAAGSQIRHLGQGSEGIASLVAHPEHGVAVRKLYDPKGMATPEMIRRKEEVGRAVRSPDVAQFYGSAPTPHGDSSMHFSEFVSPQGPHAAPQGRVSTELAVNRARQGTIRSIAGSGLGYSGAQDIRKANMVWDGSTGRMKSVDYMPSRRGEFYQLSSDQKSLYDPATKARALVPEGSTGDLRRLMAPTDRGQGLIRPGETAAGSGQLTGSLLGGRPAGPPRLAVGSGVAPKAPALATSGTMNLGAPKPPPIAPPSVSIKPPPEPPTAHMLKPKVPSVAPTAAPGVK